MELWISLVKITHCSPMIMVSYDCGIIHDTLGICSGRFWETISWTLHLKVAKFCSFCYCLPVHHHNANQHFSNHSINSYQFPETLLHCTVEHFHFLILFGGPGRNLSHRTIHFQEKYFLFLRVELLQSKDWKIREYRRNLYPDKHGECWHEGI